MFNKVQLLCRLKYFCLISLFRRDGLLDARLEWHKDIEIFDWYSRGVDAPIDESGELYLPDTIQEIIGSSLAR